VQVWMSRKRLGAQMNSDERCNAIILEIDFGLSLLHWKSSKILQEWECGIAPQVSNDDML
jgi:hypothetical protein